MFALRNGIPTSFLRKVSYKAGRLSGHVNTPLLTEQIHRGVASLVGAHALT